LTAALLLALLAAQAGGEIAAPPFTLIYPASHETEARRIAAAIPGIVERQERSLGSPPLPPSRLWLLPGAPGTETAPGAPEGSPGVPGIPGVPGVPSWAAGVALPRDRAILIWPDRVGRYTQRHLLSVVAHETAHLIAHEAAGRGADLMPRWFREGVASNMAREGEWMDFFYLWASPISSSDRPIAELSGSFSEEGSIVMTHAAYAGSFSFVGFILGRHGGSILASIMRGLREGLDFEEAYRAAAGADLADDEQAWSATIRGRTRWAAILTSSVTLWLTITLIATLAYLRKRRRSLRTIERWTEEDPLD
jgi:hypothetical protein